MKKLIIPFMLLILILTTECFSQSASINFMLGFPQGEFKQNVDRTGFGGSAQFMFWDVNPSIPFTLGLNLGYLTYGSENRNEPFSLTIPDVRVNVNRTNNLINFHLILQLMPPFGVVRPYIEGLGGGSYLFTTTEINSQGTALQQVASSTNFDDWAWSYGGGGGLMFRVYGNDEEQGGDTKITSVWIDLKARYLLGSQASYLKEGSVTIDQGNVTYNASSSETNIITGHIGVVLFFR